MMHISRGLFQSQLRVGVVSAVEASSIRINLQRAGASSGSHIDGDRYGLGEVGEFVIIEGERTGILARIIEVRLPERERHAIEQAADISGSVDAIARAQLLGSIALDSLRVATGVEAYPRLGDRVFSAPASFIASVPTRMEAKAEESEEPESRVTLRLGSIGTATAADVEVSPERLFGRHCAVLGATGGGKSYTVSRLMEECIRFHSKLVLFDATGEYRDLTDHTTHVYLGAPSNEPTSSTKCSLPPSSFTESDFLALFQPAGKTQGPKLRSAIRSLRLIKSKPQLSGGKQGLLVRMNRLKKEILDIESQPATSRLLDDPCTPFDVHLVAQQIVEECVYENAGSFSNPDFTRWGGYDGNSFSYCMTLLTRINGAITSKALECVFGQTQGPPITEKIDEFLKDDKSRLLRISLEGIHFEFSAREIIANALGRYFLTKARAGTFRNCPTILFVDEAHNFLGRSIGDEDSNQRLDAFEIIAKEGRKYWLNLCLATQRPRDITEGVLSQMGTLIVHRLTNDRDREVVERACGEIDRSASAFLPNLKPGEAAIVGVDFPIPLTIQIAKPTVPPLSSGAQYQQCWCPASSS